MNAITPHAVIERSISMLNSSDSQTEPTKNNSIELQRNYPVEQYQPHAENDEHDSNEK